MRSRGALVRSLFVGLLIFAAAAVSAQSPLTCVYLEGTVVLENGVDRPLQVGEELPGSGVLRLGPSGYAELRDESRTLRLLGPGEYHLSEFGSSGTGRSGLTASLGNRMRRLLRDDGQRDVSAAGVRGDLATEDEWALLGPAAELRTAAGEAVRAGRPDSAEELYREALLYAEESEVAIRLELAELLLGRGQFDETLELTGEIEKGELPDPWAERYFLARGGALFGAGQFEELLALIDGSRSMTIGEETRLYIELLGAEAAMGLGDEEAARASLRRVISLGGESPQGVAARRMLEELSAD